MRRAAPLTGSELATIELFERARVAVVYITTQARVVDPWTRNAFNIPRGSGSGFSWDGRGHVVTNRHVIASASGARVRLADGRDAEARLVGVSPAHDLAVLRIDVQNPPPARPIGRSGDLRVGQTALAIGNPFGLDWTLTTGVVSAECRRGSRILGGWPGTAPWDDPASRPPRALRKVALTEGIRDYLSPAPARARKVRAPFARRVLPAGCSQP